MITIWNEIKIRQQRNEDKYGKGFNSSHKMYSVLKEEVEEYLESTAEGSPVREELLDIAAVVVSALEWLAYPTQSIEWGMRRFSRCENTVFFSRAKLGEGMGICSQQRLTP